jgi:hypothetical protein
MFREINEEKFERNYELVGEFCEGKQFSMFSFHQIQFSAEILRKHSNVVWQMDFKEGEQG